MLYSKEEYAFFLFQNSAHGHALHLDVIPPQWLFGTIPQPVFHDQVFWKHADQSLCSCFASQLGFVRCSLMITFRLPVWGRTTTEAVFVMLSVQHISKRFRGHHFRTHRSCCNFICLLKVSIWFLPCKVAIFLLCN